MNDMAFDPHVLLDWRQHVLEVSGRVYMRTPAEGLYSVSSKSPMISLINKQKDYGSEAMKQELGGGFGEATLSAWQEQIQATLGPSIKQQCLER